MRSQSSPLFFIQIKSLTLSVCLTNTFFAFRFFSQADFLKNPQIHALSSLFIVPVILTSAKYSSADSKMAPSAPPPSAEQTAPAACVLTIIAITGKTNHLPTLKRIFVTFISFQMLALALNISLTMISVI